MIKYYFGTSSISIGHYVWLISEHGRSLQDRTISFDKFPFSPEHITQNMQNGQINWQHHKSSLGDFTVCAIVGSCFDKRSGSKSVFIVNEIISFFEMKERILSTPICLEIINTMPFPILWNL